MTGQDRAEKKDGNKPLVSIIIPVYNSASFITGTLDSILDQELIKGGAYTEIIVVDDGSSDSSVSTVRNYVNQKNLEYKERKQKEAEAGEHLSYVNRSPALIRILPNRHRKGAAGARNTGIDAAGGRYIAFIDSDDRWMKEKLSRQTAFMQKTGAAFSFTGYEFADEDCEGCGKVVRVPERISYSEALKNTTIFTSTVMFDMNRLKKADIYFPYVESEDTANWWKVLKNKGDAFGLDENLTLYRRSANTLSSNKLTAVRRIWALYRRVEKLPLYYSLYCFMWYALRAVKRRV
ncbi:MAG: glycosyltransferase family 2 protein [Lachnospiraceae bacterium]|nr:glycosyltransferase family 2 protein [Lachnospiraceae bacterium]